MKRYPAPVTEPVVTAVKPLPEVPVPCPPVPQVFEFPEMAVAARALAETAYAQESVMIKLTAALTELKTGDSRRIHVKIMRDDNKDMSDLIITRE